MEPWQVKYVIGNLTKLTEYIICNTGLLTSLQEAYFLGSEDVEKIEHQDTNLAKSKLLLDILKTRTDSYAALVKSCFHCVQTGAAQLLFKGYQEEGIKKPLYTCGIPIELAKILGTKVVIQGKVLEIKQAFPRLIVEDLDEIIKSGEFEYEYMELVMMPRKQPMTLVKDTIPPRPTVYISRSISNRLEITADIFKETCLDIFVLKDIERYALSKLARPNTTSVSGDQIYELNSRFILLENFEDWKKIRTNGPAPKHLLRFEKDPTDTSEVHGGKEMFILEETTGDSEILWNFVSRQSNEKRTYITEDEFVDNLEQEDSASGICICDTPGMGKTYLLSSIAAKVADKKQGNICAYFRLSEFISQNIFDSSMSMTYSIAINAVLDWISTLNFFKAILKMALDKNLMKLELFFDGLDEVPTEQRDIAKEFLKNLTNCGEKLNIRIYVTARPHLRKDLETTLSAVSYDIMPFTDENQIQFLAESWELRGVNSGLMTYDPVSCKLMKSRLYEFASVILDHFRKDINQNERDLFGIPLLCYLLFEAYTREAMLYSDPKRKPKKTPILYLSIYELYMRFFNMRFQSHIKAFQGSSDGTIEYSNVKSAQPSHQIVKCPKPDNLDPNLSNEEVVDLKNYKDIEIENIRRFHVWQALCLLFPEVAQKYAETYKIDNPAIQALTFSIGILEQTHIEGCMETRFVHRSFAEFLVGKFFAEVLMGMYEQDLFVCIKDIIIATVKTVLDVDERQSFAYSGLLWVGDSEAVKFLQNQSTPVFNFRHSLIVCFINMVLGQNSMKPLSIKPVVQMSFCEDIHTSKLFGMLSASARFNHINVFRFLKSVIKSSSHNVLEVLKPVLLFKEDYKSGGIHPSSQLLYLAAQHPVQLIIECFDLFHDCFQYNFQLSAFLDEPPNWHIPLHRAVELANYQVVEYLVENKNFSVEGRQLVYYCVQGSYRQSQEKITKILEVLKYLLFHSKSLLYERAYWYGNKTKLCVSPLFSKEIHPEIFKHLLIDEKASNPEFLDRLHHQNTTIVHEAARYMLPNDFDEFCQFLIEDVKVTELFTNFRSLHFILRHCKNLQLQTLTRILQIPRITLNSTDSKGFNTLHLAVRGNQSLEIVKKLVSFGANFNCKTKRDQSLLLMSARRGNKKLAEYFLSLKISLEERNDKGNTPFLVACRNLEMIKCLAENNSNLLATNKEGETIVHKAARAMKSADDFHALVILISENWNAPDILMKAKGERNKETPLHTRLFHQGFPVHVKTVQYLLKGSTGANVNQENKDKNSFLHAAVIGRKPLPVLKELVKSGVDFNLKNVNGESALDLAVRANSAETIEYLKSLL